MIERCGSKSFIRMWVACVLSVLLVQAPTVAAQPPAESRDQMATLPDDSVASLRARLNEVPESEKSDFRFQLASSSELSDEERQEYVDQLRDAPFSESDPILATIAAAKLLAEQGRTALAQEQLDKAIKSLQANQLQEPLLLQALFHKIQILRSGRENEAIEAAIRLIRLADHNRDTYYRIHARRELGDIAWSRGAWVKAAEYFQAAQSAASRQASPADAELLWNRLGRFLLRFGMSQRSENAFGVVVRNAGGATSQSELFDARIGLAEVRLAQGQADLTEFACRQLIDELDTSASPDRSHRLNELLARSLLAQWQPAAALELVSVAQEEDAEDDVLRVQMRLTRATALARLDSSDEALSTIAVAEERAAADQLSVPAAEVVAEMLHLKRDVLSSLGETEKARQAGVDELALRSRTRDHLSAWLIELTSIYSADHGTEGRDRVLMGLDERVKMRPEHLMTRQQKDQRDRIAAELRDRTGADAIITPETITASARKRQEKAALDQAQFVSNTFFLVAGVAMCVVILYLIMNGSRKLANQKRESADAMRRLEHELNDKLTLELEHRTQELEVELLHREKMERALEQTRKAEAIARLTSGVAHDFNNLMTVVIASNEVLKLKADQHLDASQVELIDDSTQAARSASDITRQLLAYSKKQPLRPREIRVDAFVRQVSGLLRRTLGDRIEFEISVECPQLALCIDTSQLTTALINLCANARDAIPETGRVVVTISHQDFNQNENNWAGLGNGDYVVISVADTGSGMTNEECRRAAEPFFTTKSDDNSVAGVGLGLSVVDGFLRQSGGIMRIESEPGGGTIVSCIIPAAVAEENAVAVSRDVPIELQVQKILIVDDDVPVRKAIEGSLSAHGFETWTASSSQEAIDLLESGLHPRLVLTDIRMRGNSSGIELAKWLQENHPDIRVILMTGYADQVSGAGFDVISKPFQIAELVERLHVAA
jgi:signal transduction histidine kinase